jgi:hypothetical protein
LTHTHFPGERLRPLGHRSALLWKKSALSLACDFRKRADYGNTAE